ncbi:MAG: hypothetical protein JW810_06735 [Sedimentisphaerales bacterium]|nr:hypothetical protein [Sedimentisphaerales bacterium]
MRKWKYVLGISLVMVYASVVEADVPDPVGVWYFDAGNPLAAAVGGDLELVGSHAVAEGMSPTDGAMQIDEGSYYRCPHGIAANGGGSNVNQWTLLIDFYYPAESLLDPPAGYIDLLQCDYTNISDSDWTIRGNPPGGIGISAVGYSDQYGYVADPNVWYRMVVPIDNGTRHDLFMDGNKIFAGIPQPIDDRFSLHPAVDPNGVALLFCAGNNQDGDDALIRVTTVAIWDRALSYGECKALREPGYTLYPPNAAPEVDAGANRSAELEEGGTVAIPLDATVIDDGPYEVLWEKLSGPNDVIFDDAAAEDTTATFTGAGTYILRLTADDGEFVESDTVSITVVPFEYTGPRVHWKFDEPWNGTTVEDSSGLYNHGTILDGPIGMASYLPGYINNGLDLNNGQDINSQNGDRVALNYVMTNSGTIATWMKPHALYNYNSVFDNSVQQDDWEMWIYSDSRLRFRVQADSYVTANLNNLTDGDVTNDWVHVAVTWDRTDDSSVRVEMYVNGQFIEADTGAWVEPGSTFFLGGGHPAQEAGYAQYDDFRMYARVLSACEISQIRWGGNTPPVVDAGPDLPDCWMDESGSVTRSIDATVTDLLECGGTEEDEYVVQWTKISGPNDIVIHSPDAEDTQITILAPGAYVLQLEADDGEHVGSDTMSIEVFPAGYTGLLVHWPLDDGQYDPVVTDVSGNDNDGTWVDGADGTTAMVPGRLGKAIHLQNGNDIATTGDYLSVPLVMADEGSIALWYQVFSLYDYVAIFDNQVEANDWEMWIYASGILRGRVQGGTEVSADLHALAPDGDARGDWFHMVFTWKRTSATTVDTQLYVNGDLIQQSSGPWVDPGTHFYIAGGNNGNEGSDGIYDDIRVYRHALFPGEVKLLASLSDYNKDRTVDLLDLKEMMNRWLTGSPGCDATPPFDYNMDCDVDMADYAQFAPYWLLGLE